MHMVLRRVLVLFALLPALWSFTAPRAGVDDNVREGMATAISTVTSALVRLHVVIVDCDDGKETAEEAYGSGVIISKDGYIVTNHHVAGDARYITATLNTREEIEAELVGSDPLADIAVVKLKPDKPRTFPFARFGDSSIVKVGDHVFAMGSPLSLSQSVTSGIISNTAMVLPEILQDEALTLDGEDVGSLVRWLAHDAQIYGGNSGGPLVNLRGEIIGINEISLGLSGAIPSDLAQNVALQLIHRGHVLRSWLGLSVQPLPKSLAVQHGVLVASTFDGSPAQQAGFQPGDVLIRLNEQPVDVRFREELPLFNQLTMALPIGKPATAVVLRDGKTVTLHVVPVQRQKMAAKKQELKAWGMCASDLTPMMATQRQRTSTAGVLVSSLRTGGPADTAKPTLAEDDVILTVNGTPVGNLAELRRLTTKLTAGKTELTPVTVSFERNKERYLTVVKIGLQEIDDPGREVRKAWLPIGMQVLTRDLAQALGLEGRTGVRVTEIYPTATRPYPLAVGDIIIAVDDTPVEASDPDDTTVLPTLIRQYKPGATVTLTVLRKNAEVKVPVQLAEAPPLPQEMKKYHDVHYDFTARDLAFMDRIEHNWSPQQMGVLIIDVGEGGWAALGRMHSGDLLLTINGQPVRDIDGLEAQMKSITAKHPRRILLKVKRGVSTMFLELQTNWPAGQ